MISFVNLVQLLSEHQLYISESGLIARYGKTKGVQGGNLSGSQRAAQKVTNFFFKNSSCMIWVVLYFVLNMIMLTIGIGAADRAGKRGWNLVAFGAGPALSMNSVLVLLPTLSSLIHAMRSSTMMNKVHYQFKESLRPLEANPYSCYDNACVIHRILGIHSGQTYVDVWLATLLHCVVEIQLTIGYT